MTPAEEEKRSREGCSLARDLSKIPSQRKKSDVSELTSFTAVAQLRRNPMPLRLGRHALAMSFRKLACSPPCAATDAMHNFHLPALCSARRLSSRSGGVVNNHQIQVNMELPAISVKVRDGELGFTPVDNPAPRWAYVHKLRRAGLWAEIVHEHHGGACTGRAGRYVLHSLVEPVEVRHVA